MLIEKREREYPPS